MPKWAVCFGYGGLVRNSGEVVSETGNSVLVKTASGEEAWGRQNVKMFADSAHAQAYFAEKLKSESGDQGNPW